MKFTLALLFALPLAAMAQAPAQPAAEQMKPEAAAAAPGDPVKDEVQLNEEEMKKARAEEEAETRKRAAEDAAAERKAQKEARMALCVIRPVMSDEQIDLCRVAYKD